AAGLPAALPWPGATDTVPRTDRRALRRDPGRFDPRRSRADRMRGPHRGPGDRGRGGAAGGLARAVPGLRCAAGAVVTRRRVRTRHTRDIERVFVYARFLCRPAIHSP